MWYGFVQRIERRVRYRGRAVPIPNGRMDVAIGARLKELRIKNNKSLQEVADAIGISKAHVWNIEKGESANPSMDILNKLADFFRVGVSDLVGENPHGEKEPPELVAMYRDLKELGDRDRKAIEALIKQFKSMKGGGD